MIGGVNGGGFEGSDGVNNWIKDEVSFTKENETDDSNNDETAGDKSEADKGVGDFLAGLSDFVFVACRSDVVEATAQELPEGVDAGDNSKENDNGTDKRFGLSCLSGDADRRSEGADD